MTTQKPIIFFPIIILFVILSSCAKPGLPVDIPRDESSALIQDWIKVHVSLIRKTTGVTHVAFARHFAYTGVALYESLSPGYPQFKSIRSILNTDNTFPTPEPSKKYFWPAAANAAIAEMLRFFYAGKDELEQKIDSVEQVYFLKYSGSATGEDIDASVNFGKSMADAVINWSKADLSANAGISYAPPGENFWEPTPPAYAAANVPGWGNNRTVVKQSIDAVPLPVPLPFSTSPASQFYDMAREVHDISKNITAEQKAIANFWDDAPNGKYVSAFGHWFNILKQVLQKDRSGLMKAAQAYVLLGAAMNDAIIFTWKTKYHFAQVRPVTYVRKYLGDATWLPLIGTPPHPEFLAAHATLSAAAAAALETAFGKSFSFEDHTYDDIGMSPRIFPSFEAAGWEAGISRLYGGIHYRRSIDAGNAAGKKVFQSILDKLNAIHH